MKTKELDFGAFKVTVRTETGNEAIDKMLVNAALQIYSETGQLNDELPRLVRLKRGEFASAFVQSTVEGDIGFNWPDILDDSEDIIEACNNWLELPGYVITQWLHGLIAVDQSPNVEALKPANKVNQKKDKTPKSD